MDEGFDPRIADFFVDMYLRECIAETARLMTVRPQKSNLLSLLFAEEKVDKITKAKDATDVTYLWRRHPLETETKPKELQALERTRPLVFRAVLLHQRTLAQRYCATMSACCWCPTLLGMTQSRWYIWNGRRSRASLKPTRQRVKKKKLEQQKEERSAQNGLKRPRE